MNNTPGTVADRLRGEVRAEMGRQRITRQTLSDRTGIPIHALDRRLSGRVDITLGEAEAIANALNVPFEQLIRATVAGAA